MVLPVVTLQIKQLVTLVIVQKLYFNKREC